MQPVQTVTLPEPEERTSLTYEHVAAQLVQNAAGGVGVGAALAVALWWTGVEAAHAWPWATGTAVIMAGLSTAARSWADELRDLHVRARWQAAIEDAQAQADEADEAADTYRRECETLRQEVSRLRWLLDAARTQESPGYRSAQEPAAPELADARTLIGLQAESGRHPARATLRAHGWDDARTAAAFEVLRASGIFDGSDPKHPRWLATGADALAKLVA